MPITNIKQEELEKITSKEIEDLTLKELEEVILYFIKRNSNREHWSLFDHAIGDLETQFGLKEEIHKTKRGQAKLAKALNQLIKKNLVKVLFKVTNPYIPGFEDQAYSVECVLKITKQ